jgi:hypothetical protein
MTMLSIKNFVTGCLNRIAEARFAFLRHTLPIELRTMQIRDDGQIIQRLWYDLPCCPDSAGYVALSRDDACIRVSSVVERDFRRPRLTEVVFVDGKRLAAECDGRLHEQRISHGAEILYVDRRRVKIGKRTCYKWQLVQIIPFCSA